MIPDATQPGDVVCLEGVRAAAGVESYARVVDRARGGLRVSWHGVEYLAVGAATGRDAGGRAVWRVTGAPEGGATNAAPAAEGVL